MVDYSLPAEYPYQDNSPAHPLMSDDYNALLVAVHDLAGPNGRVPALEASPLATIDTTTAAAGQVVAVAQADPLTYELTDASTAAPPAEPVYIPAAAFIKAVGSPVLAVLSGRFPTWELRDANSDRIGATITPPSRTGTVDVDVLWMKSSTAAIGEVVWQLRYRAATIADAGEPSIAAPAVTAHADTQSGELRRTRLANGISIGHAMSTLLLVDRLGSDPADTFAGSVHVVGVLVTPKPDYPGVLSEDGGWYTHNEHWLVADEPSGNVYCGLLTSQGDAAIAALDVATGARTEFTLHERFQMDDHAVPAPLVLADGTVLAFYSRHSIVDDPIYLRRTTNPGDITAWEAEEEIALPTSDQPCYPKPALVGSRIYVFFRNVVTQDFIYSDDNGLTWSAPASMFTYNTGWRGYVNYHVSPDGRVDFITNNDNPNTSAPTNMYHCYLQGGNLHKSDGTLIEALGAGGITTAQMTKIYDIAENGDAWGYDLQRGADGHPVCVFATFPTLSNHLYYYARWTGTAWVKHQMTYAGPSPYDVDGSGTVGTVSGEPRYSGGLHILSSDTSVVYLSRWVDGQLEIERWQTSDGGTTWTSAPVTLNSAEKNMRPTTPEFHFPGAPEVVWMAGWYVKFVRYHTRVVYLPAT